MRDLAEASVYEQYALPKLYLKQYYCVSAPSITDTCETDRERPERSERHHHDTVAHSSSKSPARPPLPNKSSMFYNFLFFKKLVKL